MPQHGGHMGSGDAGRNLVQFEHRIADDDGVTGIIAPLVANNHRGALGQMVHDLAFSLVTPLGADHNDSWHDILLYSQAIPRS